MLTQKSIFLEFLEKLSNMSMIFYVPMGPDMPGCLFHFICLPIPEGGMVTACAHSLVVFFQNKTHSNRDHRHIMVARVAVFSEHQLCQF